MTTPIDHPIPATPTTLNIIPPNFGKIYLDRQEAAAPISNRRIGLDRTADVYPWGFPHSSDL